MASSDVQSGRGFSRVLVANRGEIARRIFRTLRDSGLQSVAVYSDADARSAHVDEADVAVRIGPAPSRESYLNVDALLDAARRSGAEAVHPGYGFLSENADFARACVDAGLVFIGPSADAIERMGRKDEAKALARDAGVPVLDGFALDGLAVDEVARRSAELGFPLLLKATAGGGGKGMRVVASADELPDAIDDARREAENSFGDGALLIEPYLRGARHVEVQVFADRNGSTVHLFERDCSVQRRHQKILEEAPCPALDDDLRQRMGAAAVGLARAVAYEGAGTVEFLLDADGRFFFLEMNTRLQVEHPVTEAVTGLDLVALQLDVARGRPLPFSQEDLTITGHAIEARIYAEDPDHEFLPDAGTLQLWREPSLPGLRVDSGVREGDEVTVHYDPMLAKIIAHGADRTTALGRLRRALETLAVAGVTTNRDFLIRALQHPDFEAGAADTGFVAAQLETLKSTLKSAETNGEAEDVISRHALAATLALIEARAQRPSPVPGGVPTGWRNNRWRWSDQHFTVGERELEVQYRTAGDQGVFEMRIGPDGDARTVRRVSNRGSRENAGGMTLEVDGLRSSVQIGTASGEIDGGVGITSLAVHGDGATTVFDVTPRFPPRTVDAVAGGCAAPMTGLVLDVRVAAGDRVKEGDTLVILEAMKMEHRLLAAHDGAVTAVHVEAGQMVDPDVVLVVVEADGGGATS
ncbi:MAG: biotin carboxylase N-terminal domain-containing protein [Acidobacteriota bacterium]